MRFVEPVPGEGFHLFVNVGGGFFGNVVFQTSAHEFFTELFHHVQFLFTHGFAQGIGFPGGEAAQTFGNFHNLFLVHHTTVGVLQYVFQQRGLVDDFFLPVFAAYEHIHHARFHRAGAIQRHQGGHVAEFGGLQLFNQVAHAAAFQLEDAQRFAGAEQIVCFFVVQRDFVDVKIGVVAGANHFFGVINNR